MGNVISVLHIGLPLEPPWLSVEDSAEIRTRLAAICRDMERAGYRYKVFHASPQGGLAAFRLRLRKHKVDAVIIGGGVVGDPGLATFKQQIAEMVHHETPGAKLLEYRHDVPVRTLVEQALGLAAADGVTNEV